MYINNLYYKIQKWLKNTFFVSPAKYIVIPCVCILIALALAMTAILSISLSIKNVTEKRIITQSEVAELDGIDYIIVLGAGLRNDGSPSDMLTDRLLTGIAIVEDGSDATLLLSGDNSGKHYKRSWGYVCIRR